MRFTTVVRQQTESLVMNGRMPTLLAMAVAVTVWNPEGIRRGIENLGLNAVKYGAVSNPKCNRAA